VLIALGGILSLLSNIVIIILGLVALWPVVVAIYETIAGFFAIFTIIGELVGGVGAAVAGTATAVGAIVLALVAIIVAAVGYVVYYLAKHWNLVKIILGDAWEWVKNTANSAWEWLKGVFDSAWNWVLDNVFQPTMTWIERIIEKVKSAWEWLAKVGGQVSDGLGGAAFDVYHNVTGGFADGGIAYGPQTGHLELLHGTEAVIPLGRGSIPVIVKSEPAASARSSSTPAVGHINIYPQPHQSSEQIAGDVFRLARRRKS
jgi:hypothetical protein